MHQDIRFCKAQDGVRLAYAVSGDEPPVPVAWRAVAALISSLTLPLSSARKKNSLRNSALSVPSQTAVKGPSGRKGDGAWPSLTKSQRFGVVAVSKAEPAWDLKVTARPGSPGGRAGCAGVASVTLRKRGRYCGNRRILESDCEAVKRAGLRIEN